MSIEIEVYYTAGAWHWRRMNHATGEQLSHSGSTFTTAVLARTDAETAHPGVWVTPMFVSESSRLPAGW